MKEQQHFFKRKEEFPNHFAQGINPDNAVECEKRINLLSECLAHILCRLKIPYQRGDEVCHEGFFEHLSSAVKKNYREGVQLYIGGGVVRSLLAYLYWYLHTKNVYNFPVLNTEEILSHLLENVDKSFHPAEVLGVGSDLDIYYIIPAVNDMIISDYSSAGDFNPVLKLCDGGEQSSSGTLLEAFLKESVNAIEKAFHLSDYMDSLKKSFIPICDVKPYYAHLDHVIRQGGSHCDWLAFEFCGSATGKARFKIPEEDPTILHSLLIKGKYAYTLPQEGFNTTQKQTIRGCRGLLELPFVKISEPEVLSQELTDLKNSSVLDHPAKDQLRKLVRNAYFGAANNRVYRSKPNHPLAILGALSQEEHQKTKDPYLIPYFLPGFFDRLKKNKKNDLELEAYLISREQFILNYTDQGNLYHGTSQTGLLSIIRSGFWISDSDLGQGTSLYGPGVYCTPLKTTAESYTKDSTVHYLQITLNPHYTPGILNWDKVSEEVRQSWESSSIARGYAHVFLMLREEYGIDIIIHTHIILQNFYAIKVPHRPERLIQSRIDAVLSNFDHKDDFRNFTLFIDQVIPLYYLAKAAGIKLKDALLMLTERFSTLFLIRADYNPLASLDQLNCQVEYLSALSQSIDVLLDGIEETTAEELFLTGAKYGLTRLMATLGKAGISINVCDYHGNTALHWAANNECMDTVAWLVKHKAILTLPNHKGEGPLYFVSNKPSILVILKENNSYDFPLHLAAQENNLDFVEELQSWSIDARDVFGLTPLHYAFLKGHIMMIDALLTHNADINISTPEGETVLSLAQDAENAILLQYITRYKLASVSLPPQTLFAECLNEKDDFNNALRVYFLSSISFENSPEIQLERLVKAIGIFLKAGKNQIALALVKDHETLLKIQADYPKFDFFEKINMALRDLFEDTAEPLDFLKPFITIDFKEIDTTSELTIGIFLSAVKYKFEELVLTYLQAGMNVNLCKKYGDSALSLCIQYGHANLLKRLADHGAIFSARLSNSSVLDNSVTENNSEIIIALQQIKEENDTQFLTHVAARTGNLPWIFELLEQDASLFIYDRYGFTPLQYAAMEGHVEIMEALLQKGALLAQLTFKGKTVFHLAAKYGRISVIIHFLTQTDPAIWNVLDKKSNSVSHLAVQYGHAEIIATLITRTPTIFCLPNRKGKTPLELVWDRPTGKKNKLKLDRSPFKKVGIGNFLNIDFKDILSSMMYSKSIKSFDSLPKNYQHILKTLRSYRTSLYHFPLHVAAREGNKAVFENELSQAEIHQQDFYGFTPLHYAALKGHGEIVYHLLAQMVKIDTVCYGGCTALHLAIISGDTKIVSALIHRQAMLTLPFYANPTIKEILKKQHIFLKEKDKEYDGTTTYELDGYPIHIATALGWYDIVELLIINKVDLNIVNPTQETPLDLAWEKRNINVMALLMQHGAQLNDYKKGITLCHLAAAEEELSVIDMLIQQGFDLNAQDSAGVTPAHVAVAKGKTAVIDLFLKQGILLITRDNMGLTPIQWAVANGEIKVVIQLIQSLYVVDVIVPSTCSAEHLREKYAEIILYFSNQNTSLYKKMSQISVARVEKLVAAKMIQQGEQINSAVSLADLAYLTGNTEVLNYILSQSAEKQDSLYSEKILNNQNYASYYGRFFRKPSEQYPFYENLIRARIRIEEEKKYYDENSFDSYDDYYEEDYFEPSSYEENSDNHESSNLLETDKSDEEENYNQNSLSM